MLSKLNSNLTSNNYILLLLAVEITGPWWILYTISSNLQETTGDKIMQVLSDAKNLNGHTEIQCSMYDSSNQVSGGSVLCYEFITIEF